MLCINVINIRQRISYVVFQSHVCSLVFFFSAFVLCFYFVFLWQIVSSTIYLKSLWRQFKSTHKKLVCECLSFLLCVCAWFFFYFSCTNCHVMSPSTPLWHITFYRSPYFWFHHPILSLIKTKRNSQTEEKKLHTHKETSERKSRNCATFRFHSANKENSKNKKGKTNCINCIHSWWMQDEEEPGWAKKTKNNKNCET